MTNIEDAPSAPTTILKTGTCSTLSGKSKLTYQIGSKADSGVHISISKNSGGGFFSAEWISLKDIQDVLEDRPEGEPVTSIVLTPLFQGKSVNTPAFLMAVLVHEKLLRPLKGKQRQHEISEDFTEIAEKLTSSKTTGKTPTIGKKKAVTKKAVSRKAVIKKKATARKKTV